MIKSWFSRIFTIVTLSSLAACSGEPGGGGIDGTGKNIIGTGVVIGQLDSIDTLSIDGHVFNSDELDIVINGEPSSLTELRIGMSVTADVYADQNATRLEYQPMLLGPIDNVSEDGRTLTVLGQTIELTEDTFLDSLTTEDLFEGEIFEISGERGRQKIVFADYIRARDDSHQFFVTGKLEGSLTKILQVPVSGTPINFAQFMTDRGTEITTPLKPNMRVRVDLTIDDSQTLGSSLIAMDVVPLTGVDAQNYETVKAKGHISSVIDTERFVVRGITFEINAETQYRNTEDEIVPAFELTEDAKVNVYGLTLDSGSVLATRISLKK